MANQLSDAGHEVVLLLGEHATWQGTQAGVELRRFATTEDLAAALEELSDPGVGAVFHASAVSDFKFGKIWETNEVGERTERSCEKFSSRSGTLLAELIPTQKLIARLRDWFPQATIVGWKYELSGTRDDVLAKAGRQISENHTDWCVANGRAYGEGFGLVSANGELSHENDRTALLTRLTRLLETS